MGTKFDPWNLGLGKTMTHDAHEGKRCQDDGSKGGIGGDPDNDPSLLSSIGSPMQDPQKGSKRGSQRGPKNGDLGGLDPGSSRS